MSIRICVNGYLLKSAIFGKTKSEGRYARGSISLKIPLAGGDRSHQDQCVNFVAFEENIALRLSGLEPNLKIGFADAIPFGFPHEEVWF